MEQISFKERNFVIAEVLACASFILNTICVVTGREMHGPTAPAWLPHFGVIYWSKTVLAVLGLFYFFTSGVFTAKKTLRIISISTLILLLYSIPMVNVGLYFFLLLIIMAIKGERYETYGDRIPVQIMWFIPMVIVMVDLFIRVALKIGTKDKNA